VTATKLHLLVEAIPAVWEWTVEDSTAPETTILSTPPAEIVIETPALFVFSSNEPDATFECSLNGEPFAQCATPPDNSAEFSGLLAGAYTLQVRAVDPTLNTDATPASYSFTVVGPPVTTIVTSLPAAPDTTTLTSATFNFSADQSGVTFICALDEGGFSPCNSPITYTEEQLAAATGFAAGEHTFAVQATNTYGLFEEPPATFEWIIVDVVEPETTIHAGPPAVTTFTTATFVFTSNEVNAEFECSLDGAAFAGCASPQVYTDLTLAPHTFAVRAVDPAGNVDATPADWAWTVEAPAPPNTPTGANVSVVLGDITVTFASVTTEGLTTADVMSSAPALPLGYLTAGALYYDLNTTALYTGSVTVCLDYDPGSITEPIRILHYDGSEWIDITTVDNTVDGIVCGEAGSLSPFAFVGATATAVPDTTIDVAPPAFTASITADFDFSSDDPFATFECSLDEPGSWGSCEPTTTFEGLLVGPHTLLVRAVNPAGLFDASPAVYEWTVTPTPDTFIDSGPTDPTEETTATFTFSSDIPGVTFECAFMPADATELYQACSSPLNYTGLGFGEYTLLVRAIDADGNMDLTPAEWEWEVGYIPPSVSLLSNPPVETESTSATFGFTSSDPIAAYECSLDGGVFASCVSPKTYNGLALGSHTFQVRVLNPNAIAEAPITEYTWTIVDLTNPDTIIDSGPASVTGLPEASFSFHGTEPLSTFECSLDGAAFSSCSSPAAYNGLAAGEHTFSVRAIDAGGNADSTPASHTWTYAPAAEITNLTGVTAEDSTEATFSFTADQLDATFECSLDASLFAACASPVTYTGLGDGEHIFLVRAVNSFGITNPEATEYTWLIDVSAPDTTINTGPSGTTSSTSATFTFSSNEAGSIFECSLDGNVFTDPQSGEPIECLSPFGLANLTVGSHTFEVRAIDEAGNADPTPASRTWTIENTPVGSDVTVEVAMPGFGLDPATITFTQVDTAGATTMAVLNSPPALPAGYVQLGSLFYDVSTTATFSGNVTVCLSYNPAAVTQPVQLLHYDGSAWVDVTTSNDAVNGLICGDVSSLSPFAIAQPEPPADTTPPDTSINLAPALSTPDTTASFTFSANEFGSTFECSLDAAVFGACSSPVTYTDLSLGEHTFEVRAVDPADNTDPTPASYTWTVTSADITPPETTIDSGPADGTDTSATFTFSSSEPDSTFSCALDGVSSPCTSPVTYTDIGIGDHTFLVRATDAAGNTDPTAAAHEWTIEPLDTTPPETTIDSGPAADTIETTATFTFSANEPDVTFTCALDGGPSALCTSPVEYTDLSVGNHQFAVQAMDAAGNAEPTPAGYSWTVETPADTTPPQTTIDSGPASPTSDTNASFTFSASEAGSTFECSLDGAAFNGCASPQQYSSLAGGSHEFRVRAIDPAGNPDPTPASHTWTVDTPPDTMIDSGPATTTESTSATFTFSSSEAGSTFECALDGPSFSSCTSPISLTNLTTGTHEFQVRAKDVTSNFDPTPASYTWTVSAPPDTAILSSPEEATENTDATFSFSSNQIGATFECALDTDIFTICTSPVTYTGLALGSHDFQVRTKSASGTVDPDPAQFSWDIGDTTPPVVTIDSGPDVTTISTSATFTFSVDDPDAVLQCSLDGAVFSLCVSPKSYSNLAIGAHTFEVQGIKQHLLVDPVPAAYSWTVEPPDSVAPDTTITNQPADPATGAAEFAFSGSDNLTPVLLLTYECRLDSTDAAAWAACTSPLTYASLSLGAHTFEVRAVDEAGNADGTPASYTWTVISADTTPPETTIDSTPAANTTEASATFTFSSDDPAATFSCALDGVAAPCTSPVTYTDLAVGNHHFLVLATDAAGNVDPTADVFEWTVEPLQTTINGIASGSVIISFAGGAETTDQALFTFECRLDNDPFAPCTSPVTYTAEGSHTFQVRAVDEAGNADPSPASFSWTGNPSSCTMTGTITASADAWIDQNSAANNFGQDATLKARSQGPSDNFRALLKFPLPVVPADCIVESATLRLYAASWTNDRTLEAVSLNEAWTEGTVNWNNQPATVNETAATVTTALTVKDYLAWDVTSQLQAEYTAGTNNGFLIRDIAEGGGGAEQQFHSREKGEFVPELLITFAPRPDTTAPETTIDSGPEATTTSTDPTFSFSSNEAGSTFECILDGTVYPDCISPIGFVGAALGSHTFEVRATDAAGNTDATAASHSWTIVPPADTTPPETTIDSGPEASTTSTDADFTFSSSEGGSTFECSLDGAAFAGCASPAQLTGLAVGPHTFEVRATDAAGNMDSTAAAHGWTIAAPSDTTPPETTIDSGPAASTSSTSATFTFSSSESGSTFECSLDGGPFAGCTSGLTHNSLAIGAHSFSVRAVDAAGNTDGTPASHNWTVQAPVSCGPAVTVTSTADAWVDQGSPTSNKGTDSILKVMSKSKNNMRALVKFDLPQIPQGCVVQSATLRLYTASTKTGRTIQALQINASWTENGVTWNNQPATTGTAATTSSGNGWRQWNVASIVQSMYTSGLNHGFLIRDATENNDAEQQYHSREKGSEIPQLVITFGPAP
jgi:hypothetical protein